jgi:hypothetical protein
VTRPEPTIHGNCESWDFIVGKKPALNSPKIGELLTLTTGSESPGGKFFTILSRSTPENRLFGFRA